MSVPVLIVEDDHATQSLLRAVLHHHAIASDTAGDGNSALAKLSDGDYSAILLDLLLPGKNGFEILRYLKESRPEMLPCVVVVTAAADGIWRGRAELDLVRCVLRKPLDLEELMGHVHGCMRVAAGLRQA